MWKTSFKDMTMENKVYKKYKGGAGARIHEKKTADSWAVTQGPGSFYSGKCQQEKKDFFELKLYSHIALRVNWWKNQ